MEVEIETGESNKVSEEISTFEQEESTASSLFGHMFLATILLILL